MKTISVDELKEMLDNNEKFQFVDVRETGEYNQANLGAELIPMSTIQNDYNKISKEGTVVVMCRSGNRSGRVIGFMEQNYGYDNLVNLEGGILAWKEEIDSSIDVE